MKKIIVLVLMAVLGITMLCAQTVQPKTKRGQIVNKKTKIDQEIKFETYTINCPVNMDTWIYAFRPDSNYGNGLGWKDRTDPDNDLTVQKMFLGFGGTDKKAILLQFDLTKLPKDKTPLKAVVKAYNDFAGSDAPTKVDLKMVQYPWDEMKVTWKNKPSWTSVVISTALLKGSINYGQPGKWYEWDVARLIEIWVKKNKPNYGVVLDPRGDSGVDRDFICREYKGMEQYFPVLEVTYKKETPKITTTDKDTVSDAKKKMVVPVKN